MKATNLYIKSFSIIVCLIIGVIQNSFAKNSAYPPTCTIDCSVFDDPEYYDCRTDFPEIHPSFRDFTTNGNEDINAYMSIGGIISNCSNLTITVQDFIFPPNDCTDSLRVQRRYRILEGNTVVTECFREFVTFNLPITIVEHAKDEIVSCTDNVDSLFNEWIDAYGNSEIFLCQGVPNVVSFPQNPFVFYGDCRDVIVAPDTIKNIISGEIRVQWDFIDDCGVKVSTIANFFVIDTIGPIIECPSDMTFEIGDDNLFTQIQNSLDDVIAIADCGEFKIENDFEDNLVQYNCDPDQTIPVLFTAIDSCQNMSTCSSNIIIINEAEPEITCPPNIFLECASLDNFNLITDWINLATGEDNVGNPLDINSDFDIAVLNSSFCNQETDITFDVTDDCGRSTNCVSRIIMDDNLPPDVVCPPSLLITFSSPNFDTDITTWFSGFTSIDACNSFQANRDFNQNDIIFDCEDLDTTVTYIATDECGNSNSCQTSISISNDYASDITCGDILTLNCGEPSNPVLLQSWLDEAIGEDNLNNVLTVEHDLDLSDPAILKCHSPLIVNFTIIDLCGESLFCSQSFEIIDTTAPIIFCPDDLTIQSSPGTLDEDIQMFLFSFVSGDNCEASNVETNYDPNLFTGCELSISNDITFTVTDNCNLSSSCVSNLTIETDRFPTVICPFNLNIECGDSNNQDLINAWIAQAAGSNFTGEDLTVDNNYSIGQLNFLQCSDTLEVEFFVIDNCGLSDTCRSNIILQDSTPPEIDCPVNITINTTTSSDIQMLVDEWLNTVISEDNCLGSKVTNNADFSTADFCDINAQIAIEFTAVDSCGLTNSCSQIISFNKAAPVILCPLELNLECGDVNNDILISQWLNESSALDNSDNIVTIENDFDISLIDPSCSDSYLVEFLATDDCSVTSTCVANIFINDTQAPEVICPTDLNLLSGDPNKESKYEDYINNININDCNSFEVTSDFDLNLLAFSCDDELTLPFNLTVTDECGASSICNLTIIVSNNIVANIDCPSNLVINCGAEINQDTISQWLQETVAEDNTGNSFPVDNNFDDSNPLLTECASTILVTFEMVDLCSSAINCTSNIIVQDIEIPSIVCPPDTNFIFEDPSFESNINTWLSIVDGADNCSAVTFSNNYDASTILGNCQEELTSIIQFIVEDECGFSSNCNTNLTVSTSRTPDIICPGNLIVECGDQDNISLISDWLNTSTGQDADGNNLVVSNDFLQSDFDALVCQDTLFLTFLVEDVCNFMSDCNSRIILEDTTIPELNCPLPISINTAVANYTDLITDWLDSFDASDNCGSTNTTIDFDLNVFDICNANPVNEVIFQTFDACGLSNSCTSEIFINNASPQINCPLSLVLECGISDVEIDSKVSDFLDEASAFDNANNDLITINNDYVSQSLTNNCFASISITLSVIDNCGLQSSCQVTVSIEDTTPPELTCPSNISIDINSQNLQTQIDEWLLDIIANESCNTATSSNNYNLDVNSIDCGQNLDVEFISVDECSNMNSCNAIVTFVNDNLIDIICPEPIQVQCVDFSPILLDSFLNSVIVISQDTFSLSNDYTTLNATCITVETQDITFEVEDICGNFNSCTTAISYVPDGLSYIPNTFSPGSNDENNVFTVFSNEFITTVKSMTIFDRWGEVIFKDENFPTNDKDYGWDGYYNNTLAIVGVYVYVIEIEDDRGNVILERGHLTLIR